MPYLKEGSKACALRQYRTLHTTHGRVGNERLIDIADVQDIRYANMGAAT